MDSIFLTDVFYVFQEDKIDNFFNEVINDCDEDEQKLKNLLNEKDKDLVSVFKYALINSFQNAQIEMVNLSIEFGVKIGMIIQSYLKEEY